jgi:MOSC domain-containing protein YiiM
MEGIPGVKTIKLVSVQIGVVQTLPAFPQGEANASEWRSAIAKHPVVGKVMAGPLGIEGDEQGDRNHGGVNQAINVYPVEHYQHWRTFPELLTMGPGSFGENFTTEGLLEADVCVGDVYQIGKGEDAALVEVSQPRQPCYKLSRLWKKADLDRISEESGRIGWYFRVKRPGRVQAGDTLTLLERPYPDWSIARVYALKGSPEDRQALEAISTVEALSPGWQDLFAKKRNR